MIGKSKNYEFDVEQFISALRTQEEEAKKRLKDCDGNLDAIYFSAIQTSLNYVMIAAMKSMITIQKKQI